MKKIYFYFNSDLVLLSFYFVYFIDLGLFLEMFLSYDSNGESMVSVLKVALTTISCKFNLIINKILFK